MAYNIYETKSIILSIKDFRENDLLLKIFSYDFGYISVIAAGARKITSKHRGKLVPFSLANIALIRGKEFYRMTDIDLEFKFNGHKLVVRYLEEADNIFGETIYNLESVDNKGLFGIFNKSIKAIILKKEFDIFVHFLNCYYKGLCGFVPKIPADDIPDNDADALLEFAQHTVEYYNRTYDIKR